MCSFFSKNKMAITYYCNRETRLSNHLLFNDGDHDGSDIDFKIEPTTR